MHACTGEIETYNEYLQGALIYLDLENEKDSELIQQIRQHFARFTYKFINQIPRRAQKTEPCSELELVSIQACAATLCCGTMAFEWFQKTVVPWLDQFIAAHETNQLAINTVFQLLELHGENTNAMVIDYVTDRCYTKFVRFSDRCFTALAKIFIEVANDYPCDITAVLILTMLNVGSPRMHIHELALRLMVALCKELLWDALPATWAHNLKVILRYTLIMVTLSSCELLPHAKKVTLYICKNNEERLLNELMNELQQMESFNGSLERTDTLPFYRFTNSNNTTTNNTTTNPMNSMLLIKKSSSTFKAHDASQQQTCGVFHNKRHHSGEDTSDTFPGLALKSRTSSQTSLTSFHDKITVRDSFDGEKEFSMMRVDEVHQPAPLPLAPYGGTAAPFKTLLPELSSPIPGLFRCSTGVMPINELIVSGLQIDWSAHLPELLHIAMLGMDHNRAIRVHKLRSVKQLRQFVQWIVYLFRSCVPQVMVEERWMQLALRITLSCSSRHYTGCSLQIIRPLGLPMSFRWVIDILSRLVKTVAEPGDDMQVM
ncbi:unnamed protein product [Didymodactylos carnosus]|uniref:Protein furry n=1 Tax=Didymodactylos carnosus TaxID=1234261 RepID=A0A813VFU2_9BILA|nr:unnamed protein product [Didymodactylos carnosus]CAF3626950.1 unnamed protein product [Didymodactylos carnosus]